MCIRDSLYGADAPGKTPAEKKQVDFVGLRKRFLTVSACLMAAIVLCAVVLGVHLDTEFTGGAMITLSYENSFEMSAVQKTASEALGSNGQMCIRDRFRRCAMVMKTASYYIWRFPDSYEN